MALAPHTRANREFFEPGAAPRLATWLDWIERGVVRGKIIDGKPFVDLNWFAVNDRMTEPPLAAGTVTGLDLLSPRA
jgi:hypothetical protein